MTDVETQVAQDFVDEIDLLLTQRIGEDWQEHVCFHVERKKPGWQFTVRRSDVLEFQCIAHVPFPTMLFNLAAEYIKSREFAERFFAERKAT